MRLHQVDETQCSRMPERGCSAVSICRGAACHLRECHSIVQRGPAGDDCIRRLESARDSSRRSSTSMSSQLAAQCSGVAARPLICGFTSAPSFISAGNRRIVGRCPARFGLEYGRRVCCGSPLVPDASIISPSLATISFARAFAASPSVANVPAASFRVSSDFMTLATLPEPALLVSASASP